MAKKKVQERVAVLRTHLDWDLVIRANPTDEEVLGFVVEHNRRYHAGLPGGPSGIPAFLVTQVQFYADETDKDDPAKAIGELDISNL